MKRPSYLRLVVGRARALSRTWLGALVLATALLPPIAFAQAGGAPKGNPRLATLGIEIWPEYDRPAALVILKGALAEGVKLPASIVLRLPASSGGATAVAYSTTANGDLLNLKHEVASGGEFITLKFEVPERFFHVEYYEPMATSLPERSVRYVWPGDFAAERVSVIVQEPASASDISAEPSLGHSSTGKDGLHYRDAELGALEAGKRLAITLRYTKRDTRPSAEILGVKGAAVAPAVAAPPPATKALPLAAPASDGLPAWAFPLAGLLILSLVGVVLVLLWGRRASSAAAPPLTTCRNCGSAQPPANRFCGNCGDKLS